ncbi:hypothetical protein LJC11_02710 [Bacteroidales bacterium OttesenSCG-928-I21]|nr:hypothetical protein [Bacteroidales bacterium OttesenSCG-928-I21]
MKKFMYLSIAIWCMLAISCEKDENKECENKSLEIESLENLYGCENTKYQMDVNLSNNFIIIRSQSQFNNYVIGTCQPEINFETYDLIIGKQSLTSGNSYISYELTEDCETSNLLLFVTFHQNITTEAPNLTYHALIPKLESEQVIDIEIDIIHIYQNN